MDADAISFGRCRLLMKERVLLADGRPADIGSRALDILVHLARKRGQTISSAELMKAVWPHNIVEENTLRVQIKNLRRVLASCGSGSFVVNRSGRGYSLVAPEERVAGRQSQPVLDYKRTAPTLTRLIGRSSALNEITERLLNHRLVTVTGAGGIGKSAVVMEIASRWENAGREEVFCVDLWELQDEKMLASHVARAVGLKLPDAAGADGLVRVLADVPALIVLDTCERIVGAVAQLVELLLQQTSALRILVGSREALRVRGEWVTRLQPLPYPDDETLAEAITAEEYPAIELFMERASAAGGAQSLERHVVAAIGKICARLDGLPLAIELAAARVGQFGVEGMLAGLDHHLEILTDGLRTGSPRQRTMRSAVEWSFSTLSDYEQTLLTKLAVLCAPFTWEAAAAIAGDDNRDAYQRVLDGLNHLYRKSMLDVVTFGDEKCFRMLKTTRAFAYDQLRLRGDDHAARSRHLSYVQAILGRQRSKDGKSAFSESELHEVRAALDWSSSGNRDVGAFLDLTIAAIPMWFERSLVDECRRHVEHALFLLERMNPSDDRILDFHVALGGAYMNIEGAGDPTRSVWMHVQKISGRSGRVAHRLKSLWGLWVDSRSRGDFSAAAGPQRSFRSVGEAVE